VRGRPQDAAAITALLRDRRNRGPARGRPVLVRQAVAACETAVRGDVDRGQPIGRADRRVEGVALLDVGAAFAHELNSVASSRCAVLRVVDSVEIELALVCDVAVDDRVARDIDDPVEIPLHAACPGRRVGALPRRRRASKQMPPPGLVGHRPGRAVVADLQEGLDLGAIVAHAGAVDADRHELPHAPSRQADDEPPRVPGRARDEADLEVPAHPEPAVTCPRVVDEGKGRGHAVDARWDCDRNGERGRPSEDVRLKHRERAQPGAARDARRRRRHRFRRRGGLLRLGRRRRRCGRVVRPAVTGRRPVWACGRCPLTSPTTTGYPRPRQQ
jgi:hypothetical protein